MEIIPIEYCEVCDDHIHLNQSMASCAFEHKCGDSEFNSCPLQPFFSKKSNFQGPAKHQGLKDMPAFYFLDT